MLCKTEKTLIMLHFSKVAELIDVGLIAEAYKNKDGPNPAYPCVGHASAYAKP